MAGRAYTKSDSRPVLDKGDSTLIRYNNIASSILNSNVGGADLEDLFVNSAKEGSYLKLKSIVDNCTGGSFPLNVNARDKRTGNTALIWACKRSHSKVVNLLLTHGVDLSLQNYNKQSALEVASPLNKQAIIDCVDHGDASYTTRLLHAAWIGNHVIVNDILTSGLPVDINVCNVDGFTPLLLCTRDLYTMEKLGVQLLKNYQPTTIVNDLIQCKADTAACDSEGRTALHYCASSKASNALPLTSLLAKNTPIDIRDRRSLSPLHYACQAGNLAVAKLLIEYGANVNGEGFGGTTPLHIAAFNNFQQLATVLLEYGASLTHADDKGETPSDVARNRKFKAMLKSWRPTKMSKDTPGELKPIKVTNLAGESKAERSWSAKQEGTTSSLREGSAGKHSLREKTRLLGDMTGTPHRTSIHPSLFLGQLKASLSQPSPSASRERLSSGSGSAEKSLRPTRLNGTLSADNPLIDSTTKDILELVRRPSSYNIPPASPQPDTLTGQKASTVSPYPKLASIRSPGHGRISPYSNLPEISSNSPLTTIPENSDSLPPSVMVDREILHQGSSAEMSSNTRAKNPSQGKQASMHLPSSLPTEITQQVAKELSSTKQISAPKKINTPSKRQPRKSKMSTTRQSFTNTDTSSIKAVKSKTPSVTRSNTSNSSTTGTSQDKQVRSSAGKITVNNSGKLSDMLDSDVKSRDSETDDAINSYNVYSMGVESYQNSGAGISRELAGRLKEDHLASVTEVGSSLIAAKTTAEPAASSSDGNNAAGGRSDDNVNGNHPIRKASQGKENQKPTKIAQPKFKPTVVIKKPTNINADSKKRQPTKLPVTKPAVDRGASKNSPTSGNKSEESSVSKDNASHKQLKPNQQTVKFLTVAGDESATEQLNSVLNSGTRKDAQDDSPNLSTQIKTSKSEPMDASYTLNPSLQPTPSDIFSHHLSSKHNSSSQQPVDENAASHRASLYKPLHLLMNPPLTSTSSGHRVGEQPATELFSADQDSTPGQGYHSSTSHMNSSEYHGPIIEDIFENFPRPLYEFAAAVAQDSANQKAIQKRKKKKTQPSSKGGDSRASSATTRGSRSSNRTRKGQRNKKSKKQTEKSESEKKEGGENHAIISGVNWHINADPSSDLEIVIENDILTEEDSDGQEVKDSPHQTKRGLSLHDMSPRQRREELKNMLLLMRNSRHPARVVSSNDGTTTSLLPETMQAIQEFVSAVPNEDELTRLFALDTVHAKDTDMSGEESEESIPDVSEVVMLDDIDDLPAMVISTDPLPAQRASSTCDVEEEIPEELGERCASTAMSDIIDEILSTPVPNKSLGMSMNSPLLDVKGEPSSPRLSSTLPAKSPLTDSLLEEIKGQWRQTRQLVGSQDPSEVVSSVLTRKSSGTISLTAASAAVFQAGDASNDEDYLWNEADIVQHYDLDPASTTPVVTRLDTPVVTHEPNADSKSSTHRSDQDGDTSHLLTWRKGNVLGKGAYGTVYCGMTSDGHLIAVKQIELNVHDWEKAELEYESIQQEVELLKNLSHGNIVGFLGTSMENHVVSIFMQFIPGGTISSLLTRFGAFEERVFQRFTLQIVDGVCYLHQNDIIHRDIKGANIMLMLNGVIKLIDFGCARRLCFNLSVSQSQIFKSMKGTPYWMAPEVIKETGYGLKSDVWSIGCTVFEMATTSPPWSHMEPIPAMFAIGSNTTPVPELPDHFSDKAKKFVALCLQREEANRSSSSELLQSEFLTSKT